MQRKALLTITGSQDYNGDKDKIEMKTVGTIEHKDDSYIIRYTEAIENSNASLKSKLTIAKDESKVEMMKSGPYSSLLIIEKSKRHLCNGPPPPLPLRHGIRRYAHGHIRKECRKSL